MKKEFGSLKKEADIRRVLSKGRRASAKGLKAVLLQNDLGMDRVVISVKKSFGAAVERNRVRRRIKEALRKALAEAKTSADIVIFPDITIKNSPFIGITLEIKGLLRRLYGST